MKNKPARLCTVHGLEWESFKVPKGSIFGMIDGVPYVCTKIPRNPGTKACVWCKINLSWKEYIIHVNQYIQDIINEQGCYDIPSGTLSIIAQNLINALLGNLKTTRATTFRTRGYNQFSNKNLRKLGLPKARNGWKEPMVKVGNPKAIPKTNCYNYLDYDPSKVSEIVVKDTDCYWGEEE